MDQQITNIQTIQQTDVTNITGYSIVVNEIKLFQSANIRVIFYDENKTVFKVEIFSITGEEYSNWGTDDTYINNLVIQKYNLVPVTN